MSRSKRGSVATFLMEGFGIVVAAIVIIGLWFLGSAIYNTLVNTAQGTKESFIDLASTINEMMSTEGDITREQVLNIRQGLILAGFNNDGSTITYSPAKRNPDDLKRPDICGSGACLCICEGLEKSACEKPLQCEKIKANNLYATQSSARLCSFGLQHDSYYYLYFAGDQKTWSDRILFFANQQTCVFGIRNLQIEKKGSDILITIKD